MTPRVACACGRPFPPRLACARGPVAARTSAEVEPELPTEQLALPVGLGLLDRLVGGVFIDHLQYGDLIGPSALLGGLFERQVATVAVGRVVHPSAQQAVRSLGRADVLLAGLYVDEEVDTLDAAEHLLPSARQRGDVVDEPSETTEAWKLRLVLLGDLDNRLGLVRCPLDPDPGARPPLDGELVAVVGQHVEQLQVVHELAGDVAVEEGIGRAGRTAADAVDAVHPHEHRFARVGDDEAGQDGVDGEDVAHLGALVGLEGGPVVAPRLVEPSRTDAPVLVSYETHLRRVDALEGQQIVEGQHQRLRLVKVDRDVRLSAARDVGWDPGASISCRRHGAAAWPGSAGPSPFRRVVGHDASPWRISSANTANYRDNAPVSAKDVVLWDAESLIEDAQDDRREYITDVFRRGESPPPNAIAIAVGIPTNVDIEDLDDEVAERGPWILGAAIVLSKGGVATGKVRVRLEPYIRIRPMLLSDALSASNVARPPGLRPMSVGRLSQEAGQRLVTTLSEWDPEFEPWLVSNRRTRDSRRDPNSASRLEVRDAVGLAGIIAGIDIPGSELRRVPSRVDDLLESVLVNAHRADTEEDLLPEELRRFDGFTRHEMYSASTAVFRGRDTQLSVFNVNKKAVEVILGVDLIYWDTVHDVFTLVQYKRLERGPATSGQGEVWMYTREGEIDAQLGLMPSLDLRPTVSADWRMTGSPFWFKFVRSDAASAQDGRLLGGMYVPAEYLRLAVRDGSLRTGPRGGFRITYDNTRHLDRESFVHLVKEGLIGTMEAQSEDLHRVIGDLTAAGRSVVVAVKSRWQKLAAADGVTTTPPWAE